VLLNGARGGAETRFQANDGLIVEAASMASCGGGQAGMQGIRQVFEGEGFRHVGQRFSLMGTIMVPFWWHALERRAIRLAESIRDPALIAP
jgi:hypothetical protein